MFGQLLLWLLFTIGGVTASPTLSRVGSMSRRKVWIPFFASVRSGQLPPGPDGVHIEPVRSRTIMMSSGLTTHGEHAVAFADTFSL